MVEIENSKKWDFDETELRLGLSCGGCGGDAADGEESSFINGKRVYEETVDLKLNIGTTEMEKKIRPSSNDPMKPPAKAQVVGWPPVRSYRKNIMAVQKGGGDTAETEKSGGGDAFVKVSMDGAPYLRKVDLKMYTTYQQLSDALGKMFGSFTIGECERQGCMLELMNERKLMDLLNGSDYVPTYEDKDGDWMLVVDVPWEMFVESCKRLRIMKGTEAKGLAPRAMEKCKSRR